MRLLMLLMVVCAGCAIPLQQIPPTPLAQFVATNTPPNRTYRRLSSDVKIVSTAPRRPFVETGFIEGQSDGSDSSDSPAAILEEMRTTAGLHGCQALLVTAPNNVVSGYHGWTSTTIGYHGACLVFTDAEGEAPPPPEPPKPPMLLFRSASGTVYRVALAAREAAVRAGWVEIGRE